MQHRPQPRSKNIFFTLLMLIGLLFAEDSFAQPEAAPKSPIFIEFLLGSGWKHVITSSAKETISRVYYFSSSGLLMSTSVDLPLESCSEMADAIDSAVLAMKEKRVFTPITVRSPKTVDVISVSISKRSSGEEYIEMKTTTKAILFSVPFNIGLSSEQATHLASSFRSAPAVNARLMASIDFAKIWQESTN